MQIGGVNDGIDDLRTDVSDSGRQHAGDERQQRKRDAERLVRGPHQLEGPAAICKNAEQAALQAALLGRR